MSIDLIGIDSSPREILEFNALTQTYVSSARLPIAVQKPARRGFLLNNRNNNDIINVFKKASTLALL